MADDDLEAQRAERVLPIEAGTPAAMRCPSCACSVEESLNRALKTYAVAEPLAGMDDRIMRRVSGVSKPKSWLGWAAAVAVAVSLLLVIASVPRKPTMQLARIVTSTAHRMSTPTASTVAVLRRPRKPGRHWAKPKLSHEEWLLIRLAQSDPEQAAKSLQSKVLLDIRIDPIEVQPIETR